MAGRTDELKISIDPGFISNSLGAELRLILTKLLGLVPEFGPEYSLVDVLMTAV